MAIKGIDVSKFNGDIDWPKVKASGIDYVWVRSSFGEYGVDGIFEKRWPAAARAGVKRGAYHILHPDENGTVQAANFCNLVGKSELPPVVDLEWIEAPGGERWSKTDVLDRVQVTMDWLQYVEKRMGVKPWIYTSRAFVEQFFPHKHQLGAYGLWLPHYSTTITPQDLPAGWADWSAWQMGQGKVPGINGTVDLDQIKETAL